MAKASVTSLHQSISMTTLVAMFGDGSVTSRKGSVSKLSIMSTGDFETTQRDFHFGISRDTSSTVKCTKSGPSSMIIEKWMPSSLHGKSKARSFILESVVKLASFSSACSKRVSKIRNLFCCSRMSFESDDEGGWYIRLKPFTVDVVKVLLKIIIDLHLEQMPYSCSCHDPSVSRSCVAVSSVA